MYKENICARLCVSDIGHRLGLGHGRGCGSVRCRSNKRNLAFYHNAGALGIGVCYLGYFRLEIHGKETKLFISTSQLNQLNPTAT
jgi:hypothetical protein